MIANLVGQIILMFFLMSIGFLAGKLKMIHEQTSSDIISLLMTVIGPALIIKSLQQPFIVFLFRRIILVYHNIVIEKRYH